MTSPPSDTTHRPTFRTPLLILGETTFRNRHQAFGMLPEDRLRHLWIMGKTGSGKSTLLENLIAQDLASGEGIAVLDPHGDLIERVLRRVPAWRTNATLLFAPEDKAHPIAFNVFRRGKELHDDPALLASQLVSVFKKFWSDSWGPRLEHILRNAILAIAPDPRASLLFLYRFLTEESLRKQVVKTIQDPVVRAFWMNEFPGYTDDLKSEAIAPALNKLGAFVSNPRIRNIVAQERSRLDLADFMANRGVLLANLAAGRIGEDASRLLGGLLMTAIQLAAMERPRGSPPFIAYVDEVQHFVNDSLPGLLAESRKFGIGLVLAHQYLEQLPEHLQGAILGNVGSIILMRLGATDALAMEPEFSPPFDAHDLQTLEQHHMVVKLLARGEALHPFSARTILGAASTTSLPDARRPDAVTEQSRLRFATLGTKVEEFIATAMAKRRKRRERIRSSRRQAS